MKRRVLLFLILFAAGLVGCKPRIQIWMEELEKSVRASVSAEELEQWATNRLMNVSSEAAYVRITAEGAPDKIQKLIRESDDVEAWGGRSEDRVIVFSHGGGFGHWGLVVGMPTYRCDLGRVQSHWTNGIWFWHE